MRLKTRAYGINDPLYCTSGLHLEIVARGGGQDACARNKGGARLFNVYASTHYLGGLGACSPRKKIDFELPKTGNGALSGTDLILYYIDKLCSSQYHKDDQISTPHSW